MERRSLVPDDLREDRHLTDRATCSPVAPPRLVYDIISTWRVPGGEVVSRGQWGVAPDPARPGFFFGASRPEQDTILSATGRFEGRSGRVSGWGIADMREFPNKTHLDFRTLIRFNPTDGHVLGTRELMLSTEAPGADRFQTELFSSDGVNESDDPTLFVMKDNPLLSLADGSQIGSVTDSFSCAAGPPPCVVLDVTTVLSYPDGVVTIRTEIPIAPDPARPGLYLLGSRPTKDNIASATGAYTGRTGHLSVSGSIDMRRFPSPIPYGASVSSCSPTEQCDTQTGGSATSL